MIFSENDFGLAIVMYLFDFNESNIMILLFIEEKKVNLPIL